MPSNISFDLDVGYAADRTPLTVTIPLTAAESEVEIIKEMMVTAFAQTEGVSYNVMKTLLVSSYRESNSATHRYVQWTRVHARADELYPTKLMENIRAQKAARL